VTTGTAKSQNEKNMQATLQPARASTSTWTRLARNKLGILGFAIVGSLIVVALLAPILAPHDPEATSYDILVPPGGRFLLGSDDVGRDLLSRLIYALRISLLVGLGASLVAIAAGVVLGALAGYYGGLLDKAISGLVDLTMAFPILIMAMMLAAFLKVTPAMLAVLLGALSWMRVTRLVRAQFMSLREWEFVSAARVSGGTDMRIIFRHLLPNAVSPVIVTGTLLVAWAVLMESTLSYLGFGVQPPTPTLGNMLQNAQQYFIVAPWMAIFPGVLIALTVVGINFLGDGLRDFFDPFWVD
jgi:peptide/nickel transport system permease protein